ncbi:hypothetical protein LPJ58_000110 [Coemansia sp. RSA 1591]|nr:hypothetical protein LPJ58_000110 [Coemansia sp. RSA 1591]KAJ1768446.1 hypothetical protein LPJ69_000043 [Coemansia sp. RSA 1752]KAJ1795337.1 hypothetical protein LPJ67_000083 [Coemansia sp. RSA 1938]
MVREEKARGLRARLRQRRTRNSSEDEVRSRPTSLDLGRSIEPAMLRAGMHSLTTVPTRADLYNSVGSTSGGLALGEFIGGDEIAEDEEYEHSEHSGQPGAVVRLPEVASDGQQESEGRKRGARRESSQSMPVYDASSPPAYSYENHSSYAASDGANSDYSSDNSADPDADGDGELNAVYLKRNADFHLLFRNIPINELLIDDYGCALQRDILVQGRLYLTENFVCFYSNIFGWVTNLVIAFDEIVSIEKRMTALIIPNAIQVSTLHVKHFFGSFIYRDSAYNQLYDLWAKSRNGSNGVPETGRVEDGNGADVSRHREDVVDAYQSLSEDEKSQQGITSGDEEGSVPSDDGSDIVLLRGEQAGEDKKSDSGRKPGESPVSGTDALVPQTVPETTASVTRAVSQVAVAAESTASAKANGSTKLLARIPKTPDGTDNGDLRTERIASHSVALHEPTTCPCGSSGKTSHYAYEALDATFPLSLPLLFRVVFSAKVPPSMDAYMSGVSNEELASSFTRRIAACGNNDVRTEGWVPDPDDPSREMCIYTYDKPLGFSIGPKSTTVEDTFRIVLKDFDKSIIVEQVVKTPNVPSGSSFFVKIRHCLTWACGPSGEPRGGWSHYRMTFEVEWTKTSWIKTAIEKGSADSNKQAGEQLEKYIREWVAAHPDKEVKAESFVVVHRPRRKQGRKKREASPRGLRMEELLQSSDTKNVKAVDAAQPVVEPIVKERVAEPVRSESWHAHVPIIAVVAVVLLVATNIWRLSAPSKQYTNASEEQMSRMQQSMDAMAEQIMVLNQMLKSLVEREK